MNKLLCFLGIHSIKQYKDLLLEEISGYTVNRQQIYMDTIITRCTTCDHATYRKSSFYIADTMKKPICGGKGTINDLINKTPIDL